MTLTELIERARNSGEDFDDLEIVFRDPRPAALAAESAGSRMQVIEADEALIVDGQIILNSVELEF